MTSIEPVLDKFKGRSFNSFNKTLTIDAFSNCEVKITKSTRLCMIMSSGKRLRVAEAKQTRSLAPEILDWHSGQENEGCQSVCLSMSACLFGS